MKLKDKVVVVTGSGNGIGEAFAHRFTAEGARVVVTDIDAAAVERVTKAIDGVGLAVDGKIPADRYRHEASSCEYSTLRRRSMRMLAIFHAPLRRSYRSQ